MLAEELDVRVWNQNRVTNQKLFQGVGSNIGSYYKHEFYNFILIVC